MGSGGSAMMTLSMPEQNVEVVLESFRRFDDNNLEAAEELWSPQARVAAPDGWPEPGPVEGRDAVMRQFERLRADAAQSRIEVEVLEAGDEWVVVAFRWYVTGARSGIETVMDGAAAFRVVDDQISEGHYKWDPADALGVAGLRKQPGGNA